ncbi:unnamed protein product [Echinostoma caproni]|uniref:C3H1-type domain-containing protein n=1 Tax=Echinostoma caproni TaxID=27848 RepID=A0A183AA26_9TREM|nr:unnamed protein product [Echinostoma caproni]
MGGYDDCTRVQLNGVRGLVRMDRLPDSQQCKYIDGTESMLYRNLEESMCRMTLTDINIPTTVSTSHFMPDDLRAIVETAWTACTQDPSGEMLGSELVQSPVSVQSSSRSFSPTADTVKPNDSLEHILSILKAHTHTSTSVTCQSPGRVLLPHNVISCETSRGDSNSPWDGFHDSASHNTCIRPKMRPLLRQRESYITPVGRVNHIDFMTAPSRASTPLPAVPKPMQVHRRQIAPRKQDAIYNARYKTQPCLHYQKYKRCPLGDNCHFAHGPEELLHPQMHPKYRTRVCLNYAQTGVCPFGKHCYFLHASPSPHLYQSSKDANSELLMCPNLSVRLDQRHTVCGT